MYQMICVAETWRGGNALLLHLEIAAVRRVTPKKKTSGIRRF